MLVMIALSAASAHSVSRPESSALAKIRVLKAASASKAEWAKSASPHKKEIVVQETDGRLTLIRVVEHE
jgi:hypothetical protein